MGMYTEDRYYEPEDGDDEEVFEEAVSIYAGEMMIDECNPYTPVNWAEGLSECGYDEEQYPTPSHAPVFVIEKVVDYWQEIARMRAENHYNNHPEALYD